MTLFIVLITLGYLMGSLCSAIIICRIFNLPDPRAEGSKNPGATNVLRIAGKQYAALVMAGDILKGTIPVVIGHALDAGPATLAFTVLAAVIGHMYPVFFGFKGGKGVATAIGGLLGFHFIIGVMVAATWLLVANFSRYSSLASIVSITLAPIYSLLIIPQLDIFPPLFFMVILVLYKHKDNITRLIDGKETRIKLKNNMIEEIMESSPPTPSQESAKEEPLIPHAVDVKRSEKKLTKKKTTDKTKNSEPKKTKAENQIKPKSEVKKAKETKKVKKPSSKPNPEKPV
ncbi:MAG: glycerol-3-phosphate 1-O-acyltransferase PlsY [Legionella sp.]|nr:glycerol-3-phosphate 1-O-acyltransferase PlsY [Legionella sp.]